MGPVEIIIIVVVSAAVLAVIGYSVYKKITGKGGGCDCGCSNCPHGSSCNKKK